MSKIVGNIVCFIILSMTAVAWGAEFEAYPSLAVNEEFTDNVFETRTNRTSDFITRMLPGVVMKYQAPVLTAKLDYLFDYRHYARNGSEDGVAHTLSANGNLAVVKNFMFLDMGDEYQRVSLDVTRSVAKESLFINQVDRNVATVSPYLTFNPVERVMVKTGYRFIDTRYSNSSGIDKYDHTAFLNTAYEMSPRFNLTADYTFVKETSDPAVFRQHKALGGFRYEYSDKSFVFAQAGNAWISYDSRPGLGTFIWNAGFAHAFNTVTATAATGVRYDEDPLSNVMQESFVAGSLEKRLARGSVSFSPLYSEYAPANSGTLQTRKYGASVRGKYEFTAGVNGSLGFTAEKYEQLLMGSYTRFFQADSGLGFLLARQLTVMLSYIYTDYYSPRIATDNRQINRAILEIKKTF